MIEMEEFNGKLIPREDTDRRINEEVDALKRDPSRSFTYTWTGDTMVLAVRNGNQITVFDLKVDRVGRVEHSPEKLTATDYDWEMSI